jgi:BioD-like phosphotransacetylase family protein
MKSLYITSVERYSGKTAACLALGRHFQDNNLKVGYLKPLSLQPWRVGDQLADEDAAFVIEILKLDAKPWDLSPFVVTSEVLRSHLKSGLQDDLMARIVSASERAGDGQDILLLEGGGSLREGYVVGLPTVSVAKALNSDVLAIVKYRDDIRVVDDALAAQNRLGESLLGILINRVPAAADEFVNSMVRPYLEKQGIPVLGVLPEVRGLAAITVGELIKVMEAEVLTRGYDPEALVETLTVGAMTADAALRRFRKQTNKAVITGGDRTDIQLAALETSTACLILTGNLQPSPLIVRQAEEFGVPVLLVRPNTMEAIDLIESVFGKTRLGQPSKLAQFQKLLVTHMDLERLDHALGLSPSKYP